MPRTAGDADFAALLDEMDHLADAAKRPPFGGRLGDSGRALTSIFWHPDDLDTAAEALVESLGDHGLAQAFDDAAFRARAALVEAAVQDEGQEREHQIGHAAVLANAALRASGDARRFRAFGARLRWESDEPAWLLVAPDEHARLRKYGGPLGGVERLYDGLESVDDLPRPARVEPDVAAMAPHQAHLQAKAAFNAGRYAEVVALMPRATLDGDHGVLAELLHIDALRRLNKREEARSLWGRTADAWLAGERRVWDTQWRRLRELGRKLTLDEADPRLAEIDRRAAGR